MLQTIATGKLLDELTGSELVVYIRLVALSVGGRKVRAVNRDLHKDASTASRALASLDGRGLVAIRGAGTGRTIEVRR